MYIKQVNHILKTNCSQSSFTFIFPDSGWTLSNGSLDSDLFNLDNVKNENLKLAESIFSLIENIDNIKLNNHVQFNKSDKMIVFEIKKP